MLRYNLRALFAAISVVCVGLAFIVGHPVIAVVVAMLLGAMLSRWYSRQRSECNFRSWIFAVGGATCVGFVCILADVARSGALTSSDPTSPRVDWLRFALVLAIVGIVTGTAVSVIDERLRTFRGR